MSRHTENERQTANCNITKVGLYYVLKAIKCFMESGVYRRNNYTFTMFHFNSLTS